MGLAIQVSGAVKDYPVFRARGDGLRYLVRALVDGKPRIAPGQPRVRALDKLDLEIRRGERVGIVGRNGAGKTTLIKLLSGVIQPTEGSVAINGEVHSLLAGTIHFTRDLSLYDNARNYLSHFQLSSEEIKARLAEIEAFTELGPYFHQPVKSYSLGMRMRSEFAVATAYRADIILIDEVVGAGDIYWAEKIATRMESLCAGGSTLLLVSHALDQIMRFCERVVWIERGRIVMDGPALDVVKRYESFLEHLSWHTDDVDDKTVDLDSFVGAIGDDVLTESGQKILRWPGRGDVLVQGVWINDSVDTDVTVGSDEPLEIRLCLVASRADRFALRYLVTFWSREGKRTAVVENEIDDVVLDRGEAREVTVEIAPGQLAGAEYFLSISVFDVSLGGTADEHATRLDVVYKTFRVRILDGAGGPRPVFRMPLQIQPALR